MVLGDIGHVRFKLAVLAPAISIYRLRRGHHQSSPFRVVSVLQQQSTPCDQAARFGLGFGLRSALMRESKRALSQSPSRV